MKQHLLRMITISMMLTGMIFGAVGVTTTQAAPAVPLESVDTASPVAAAATDGVAAKAAANVVGERPAMPGMKAQIGGQCAQAAKVALANRWNPWPSRYVVMAIGMAAACGYWIGGIWSNRAQQAWNTCWPNCPWYYAFKFW